jgi:hypothetical protein
MYLLLNQYFRFIFRDFHFVFRAWTFVTSVVQALVRKLEDLDFSKREDLDLVFQTLAVFSKREDLDFHFIFRA